MLYINPNTNTVTTSKDADAQCRHDWKSIDVVEQLAARVTEQMGERYISVDCGPNTYPRFDIIQAPAIGDLVSRGFNGDYYPDGEIVSISKTLKKVTTSMGTSFYRLGNSGTWRAGHESMVCGVIDERNAEF